MEFGARDNSQVEAAMARAPDEFDRKIIALLQQDGRLSNVEVARKLRLTEGTVRKRLDRLLGDGIIRVMAVVDPATLGLAASVVIGIQTELGQINEVAQRLAAIPEVHCVNIVTGTYDVMVEAVLPSGEHLLSFLIDKISTIPGVKRTETSHVLQVVKRACDWVVPPTGAQPAQPPTPQAPPADPLVPGGIVVS
jgi:Lrp/AsnC family transcriptional regulator for asnA, asnC and gidA